MKRRQKESVCTEHVLCKCWLLLFQYPMLLILIVYVYVCVCVVCIMYVPWKPFVKHMWQKSYVETWSGDAEAAWLFSSVAAAGRPSLATLCCSWVGVFRVPSTIMCPPFILWACSEGCFFTFCCCLVQCHQAEWGWGEQPWS